MILTDMTQAFTNGGISVIPHFGQGIERNEISLTGVLTKRVMSLIDLRPELEFMRDSRGAIEQGRALIWVISRYDKTAVEDFNTWMNALYKTDFNLKGLPPSGPTLYNDVYFYLWRPIGGLQQTAERWGNYWVVEQLIEFAARGA